MSATSHASARLESKAFDCTSFQIHAVHGHEAISKLFRFEIELVSTDTTPLSLRDLAGADASLVLERDGAVIRTIHGMIAEATDLLDSEPGHRSYRLVLVPRMHRLTLIQTQDVFLDINVPDIAKRKLDLVGLGATEVETRLMETYARREFVLEYRETDLAFIGRLTEHLGISYFFVHHDDHDRVVFTDHMAGFGHVLEEGSVPFYARGEQTSVYALTETVRVMPEYFLVSDYNYRTPLVDLAGSHTSPTGFAGGVVEFGANTLTPAESAKLAEIRAQERAALENHYRGESTRLEFGAGLRFTLEGHPRFDADAELLLVEVTHELHQPVGLHGSTAPPSYKNTFRAVSTRTPYRPQRVTPKPRIHGVVTALVEPPKDAGVGKYADIDEDGRYTVRFNFDTTTLGERADSSLPVRMLQAHAGTGYGMHFPLHPGVEVAVAFEDGDPDRPLIVGAIPNAVTTSPVTRANSNVSRIQTASGIRSTIRDH